MPDLSPGPLRRPYLFYIREHWRPFSLGMIALLCTNALDAVTPWFIGTAIDKITGGEAFSSVAQSVAVVLALTLGLAVARFSWRIFWGRFHHSVAEDLRNRLFSQMMTLGPSFYSRKSTGELMSLINNDVNTFRMAIGPGILILVDALILMLFIPALMWKISPDWTVKCLILLPTLPPLVILILRRTKKSYEAKQEKFSQMSGVAQEIVTGLRVIKSYAQEENQARRFDGVSETYRRASNRSDTIDATFPPTLELFTAAGSVILLMVGAQQLVLGQVSIGMFFAFFQYIQRMIWPMEGLGIAMTHFQSGNAAFRRMAEFLREPSDIEDTGQQKVQEFSRLEVRGLTYAHPGSHSAQLKDIHFQVRAGEVVGLVGLTGSGKSTLIDLLSKLYPAPRGTILVNDQPLSEISTAHWRQMLSVASQEPFIFSRPLVENLALGQGAWRWDDLRWATELVQLEGEILNLPEKERTLLGERGVNLSGGQRQRLALARALLKPSALLIIDDALSAVDAKTEASILERLQARLKMRRDRAVILVSHRLSSLRFADRIIVLKDGAIEAEGSAEALGRSSPTFQNLAALQELEGR